MNTNKAGNPRVSIIILNWNGVEDTTECLESLKKITYPNYNVVVVDNGSSGNDADILENKFTGYIKLIRNNKNYGFAEGNNIGIRYAMDNTNPQYILLLNNDTVVDTHFLDELVNVSESDTKIGMVGPKIYYYDDPQRIWFAGGRLFHRIGQQFHIGINKNDNGQFESIKEVGFITGCALLIKTKAMKRIGLMDSDYFAYCEDTDWCTKTKRTGYKLVFVPKAKIWHKVNSTLGIASPTLIYLITRNRIMLVLKNASILNFIFLFIPFFICIKLIKPIFKQIIQGKWHNVRVLLIAAIDGLSHKWGEPQWDRL